MENPLLVIGNKNYSSWSLRAWLVMAKSGAEFLELRLPLDTSEFYDRIFEYNPAGQVPVLSLSGHNVYDSLAIAETVNEIFADNRLLPLDPAGRAAARSLCAEMHSGFTALRSAMPMNIRATGRRVARDEAIERDIARISEIWSRAEPGHWLFGEFSIVDAMYAPVAMRFPTYGVELEGRAAHYQHTVLSDSDIMLWKEAALLEEEIVDADEAGM